MSRNEESVLDKFDLTGKVAIVTGGGTGLGQAISIGLAQAGADVVVAARRLEPLKETATEVEKLGRKSLVVPTDVTQSDQVDNLIERTIKEFGKIDILVNNAGIAKGIDSMTFDAMAGKEKQIWEITDDMWNQSLSVNLSSAFYGTRAVARHMVERKQGKIVNMASGGGLRAVRGMYTYCTAKAGVIQFTRVAASTFARNNIQVNCIAPVFLLTFKDVPEEIVRRRERYVPFGRHGRPDEVAGLALYLASAASDYVTGEVFTIDGAGIATYAPAGYIPYE